MHDIKAIRENPAACDAGRESREPAQSRRNHARGLIDLTRLEPQA